MSLNLPTKTVSRAAALGFFISLPVLLFFGQVLPPLIARIVGYIFVLSFVIGLGLGVYQTINNPESRKLLIDSWVLGAKAYFALALVIVAVLAFTLIIVSIVSSNG